MRAEKKAGRTGRPAAKKGRGPEPKTEPSRKRKRPGACPACGKPVEEGWKVCPACGAPVDPGAVRQV